MKTSLMRALLLERLLELICFEPSTCKTADGGWKPLGEFSESERRCIASIEFTVDESGSSVTDVTFRNPEESKKIARQLLRQYGDLKDDGLSSLWVKIRELCSVRDEDEPRR